MRASRLRNAVHFSNLPRACRSHAFVPACTANGDSWQRFLLHSTMLDDSYVILFIAPPRSVRRSTGLTLATHTSPAEPRPSFVQKTPETRAAHRRPPQLPILATPPSRYRRKPDTYPGRHLTLFWSMLGQRWKFAPGYRLRSWRFDEHGHRQTAQARSRSHSAVHPATGCAALPRHGQESLQPGGASAAHERPDWQARYRLRPP
jgi:hypothetical protein